MTSALTTVRNVETLEAEKLSLSFDQQRNQGMHSLIGVIAHSGKSSPSVYLLGSQSRRVENMWFSTVNV